MAPGPPPLHRRGFPERRDVEALPVRTDDVESVGPALRIRRRRGRQPTHHQHMQSKRI